jgi:hypothetical protein
MKNQQYNKTMPPDKQNNQQRASAPIGSVRYPYPSVIDQQPSQDMHAVQVMSAESRLRRRAAWKSIRCEPARL